MMAEIRQRYPGLHRAGEDLCLVCNEAKPVAWSTVAGGLICEEADSVIFDECAPFSAIDWEKLRRSRYLRELRGDWLEIVTPDYQSSQGDSMSLYGCGDPGCVQCHPQTAVRTSNASQGDAMSIFPSGSISIGYMPNSTITVSYEPVANKEQSSMSPEASKLTSDLRHLVEKGEDISAISKEVDAIKVSRKHRIVNGLKGLADLAIMEKPEGHRFVLAYFKDNEARTLEGVDYAKDTYISEDDEDDEYRVYVQPGDAPVSGEYYTMKRLKECLDEREIPYHIAYFD